jgi:hypothetical protein
MVTLLRIAIVGACVAGLLAAGAWLLADARGVDVLRRELAARGLRGVVELDGAELPSPGLLRARGVRLRDPRSGAEVAVLDVLEAQVGLSGAGLVPRLQGLRGTGGRASFTHDGHGIPFVRALQALLDALSHHGPREPGAGPAPLPALEFRDIDVTLGMPGGPPRELPGCSVWVGSEGKGTRVDIATGRAGGSVSLVFGGDGLRQVTVRGVEADPSCAVFLPPATQALAADVAPRGLLDLDLALVPGDELAASATGVLRQAELRPSRLPFALEQATLPFAIEQGRFALRDARLAFPGGTALVGLVADRDGFTLDLDVGGAEFRSVLLQLVPQADQLSWLKPEDGGRLDLQLRVRGRGGVTDVEGRGGMAVERLRVGPSGVLFEDVVGSLEVVDQRLSLHEFTGRCAGGAARLAGTLDLRTGDLVADVALFDVDIARLDRALELPGAQERRTAGWLQGQAHLEGRLGDPRSARGQGQLSVRGGYLWRVPVLDAVLRALTLARPAESRADSLAVQFRVKGQSFHLDDVRLDSDALGLRGSGKVQRGGALDVKVTPLAMEGTVGDALRYLQRQLVQLEVRGTWDKPEVRVLPLKAVTGPIGEVLGWVGGLFGGDEAPVRPDSLPPASEGP